MTSFPDLFAALAAPFAGNEVRSFSQGKRTLTYITARAAMNRLDTVLGPENWWDEYTPGENSVLCRLTVRLPDGSLLTKCDAGGYTEMSDAGDGDKSGYSDAFKRAAVKFGVGRHLYGDGVPSFYPGEVANEPQKPRQAPRIAQSPEDFPDVKPAQSEPAAWNGRKLFAWANEIDERTNTNYIDALSRYGKAHNFPGRIVDWSEKQVRAAYNAVAQTPRAAKA